MFKLIEWKYIVDLMVKNFFNDFNDNFKNLAGKYILAKKPSKAKVQKYLIDKITDLLKNTISPFSITNPVYLFVVGSCVPKFNLLYSDNIQLMSDEKENLDKNIDFTLNESDIQIDIEYLNIVFNQVFDKFFKDSTKYLGEEYKNISFIRHKNLDSYELTNIIEHLIYGRSNTENISDVIHGNTNFSIQSLNDTIRFIAISNSLINEHRLESNELLKLADEIKDFLNIKRKKLVVSN